MRVIRTLAAVAAFSLPVLAAQIPRPANPISVPLPDGKVLTLDSFKGKVLVLEFMLTTCPACQKASVALSGVYSELHPKGMEALGVAINPMANMLIPEYIQKFGTKFPIGFKEDQEEVKAFLQHPVIQILRVPQLVFIDRKGVIRAQHGGATDPDFFNNEDGVIKMEVEKLLAEGGAPPKTATAVKTAAKKK